VMVSCKLICTNDTVLKYSFSKPLILLLLILCKVIVPEGISSGQTIHVNFTDEYNAQTTLSAVVPPNVIPGMVFIIEVPSQHKWTGNTADDSEVSDLLLKEQPTKMQSTYVPVYEAVPLEDITTTNTTSSVKEIV
jgi:hypothetical protein